MKKKILLFVMSCVLALGAVGLIASCSDDADETECTHNYEQTSSTEATCTEAGSVTKTCSECGDVVTETVKALGHDYKSSTSSDGTKIIYTCSRCGDSYEEDVKQDDDDDNEPVVDGDALVFTANDATLSYYYGKSGSVSVSVDGSAVTLSNPVDVVNNDTDGAWWNGGTESLSVSGDFVVQYTWTNTRDMSYTDAVVEFSDGTKYWDQTTFADLWGDLYTGATTTSAKFYLNGKETTQVALGTTDYFGGEYTVTIVRNGDELIVVENVKKTNGDVYAYVITQSGVTTDEVSTCLTGNPYWIDDIKVAYSADTSNMLKVTINYVDEDGNTLADSVVKYASEGGSVSVTSPYVKGYTPECEVCRISNVTESTERNVVYSYSYWNQAATVITDYLSGENKMTLPDDITMKSGVTISFLLSGCTSDWTAMITSLGYSITYGCLDSWARNAHNCYPSLTAYGTDNATALVGTTDKFLNGSEEIFVAVTVRSNEIIFYVNGERVIYYAGTDKMNGDSYEYYVDTWASNILNGMINYGYTFNASTYKVHRYAVQASVSDHYIAELYNQIQESYNSELVVKYYNEIDGLLGEYRWSGLAIDYSITPPDILGYEPEDTSVITGRAENGRCDVVINYVQKGIATIIFNYVDESGNALLPSETVKVTIPSYTATPPEVEDYVCTNPTYAPTALTHGKTYIQTFVYKVDTASHKYTNGVCSDCAKACTHKKVTNGVCDVCGGTIIDVSGVTPGMTAWADICPAQEVKFGESLTISGTQTSAMEENWETVLFEFSEGYTGRADIWGWTFGSAALGDKSAAGANGGVAVIKNAEGKTQTYKTSDDFWAAFKAMGKNCKWSVTATFDSAKTVTVTVIVKCSSGTYTDYVYTCTYPLVVNDTSLTSLHMRITSDGSVTKATVTGAATYAKPIEPCKTHTWDATTGMCSVCKTACTHTWKSEVSNGTLTSTCETCKMVCSHSFTNGVCDTCKYECTSHSYDKTKADGLCTICGTAHTGHTYSDKTATSPSGKCDVCGLACTHTNVDSSTMICNDCGMLTCTTHDWSNCDGVCAKCGTVCEHTGTTSGICGICGALVINPTASVTLNKNQKMVITSTYTSGGADNYNGYKLHVKIGDGGYVLRCDPCFAGCSDINFTNFIGFNTIISGYPVANTSYVASSSDTLSSLIKGGAKTVISLTYEDGKLTVVITYYKEGVSDTTADAYVTYVVGGLTESSLTITFGFDVATIANNTAAIKTYTASSTENNTETNFLGVSYNLGDDQKIVVTATYNECGPYFYNGFFPNITVADNKKWYLQPSGGFIGVVDEVWDYEKWNISNYIAEYPMSTASSGDLLVGNRTNKKTVITETLNDNTLTIAIEYYNDDGTLAGLVVGIICNVLTVKVEFDLDSNGGVCSLKDGATAVISTITWS